MWMESIFVQTAKAFLCSIFFSYLWLVGRSLYASVSHHKVKEVGLQVPAGPIIKKEGMVSTSKARPATDSYKIFLLQQGHPDVHFSDVMGCSCKTPPENITEVKVLSIQHCSTRTWDVIHHGRNLSGH